MVGAGFAQALLHGMWERTAKPYRHMLENLIGPTIFSVVIAIVFGFGEIGAHSNYLAYWYFSIFFGILRTLQSGVSGLFRDGLLIFETIGRTSIFLAMYWIFETYLDIRNASLSGFLGDPAHAYLAVVIPVLGLILGITNTMRLRAETRIAQAARRLRTLSEWSWGAKLAQAGVSDAKFLTLKRRQRTVLFADIRGFTQWSEVNTSLEVAHMLEEFYSAAETVWSEHRYVFVKHTADEILVVFEHPEDAVLSALQIRNIVSNKLNTKGLAVGIGINKGQVMEGALGSKTRKNYDVVGAAVNIASRICSAASKNEILISESVFSKLNNNFSIGEPKTISVKGKSEELKIYPITGQINIEC